MNPIQSRIRCIGRFVQTWLALCCTILCGVPLASRLDAAEPPRLIVVVSVDQLAQEYLVRFADNFAEDGLVRRVLQDGAYYSQCHHRHAYTITAPGHSVQLTGAYPNTSGIVGNNWFDRATGKDVYCMADATTRVIGAPMDTGMSPRSLLVETVGDVLKLRNRNRSKVFGVAIKDRAAILMTGHNADSVFWLENNIWITSSYYRNDLPGYLRVLNESQPLRRFQSQAWSLSLPKQKYHNTGPDKNDWENPPKGMTSEFPHQVASAGEVPADVFGDQVLFSPFGNEVTLEVARGIVMYEEMGHDEFPDILCINLSSNDYVGHAFGPHSLEVEDMTYQTDRQLGQFMKFLDERVGQGLWTMAVTSDHGVAPIAEYAIQSRVPAKRNPLGKLDQVKAKLESQIRSRLAIAAAVTPPLIEKVEEFQVYIKHDHPALAGANFELAQRVVRDWLLDQPDVAVALTRDDLAIGGGDHVVAAMHRAWHPGRSGDVLFVFRPYCVPGLRGTTHGSPWHYDTHVPMLLIGSGIQAGKFDRPVGPACLASTLSALLGIEYPSGNSEQPLHEALQATK